MSDRIPGSSWSNPVWHRGWRIYHSHSHFHDYGFAHDDFDGSDDANDARHGTARTVEEAKAEIDEYENSRTPLNDAPHQSGAPDASPDTAGREAVTPALSGM